MAAYNRDGRTVEELAPKKKGANAVREPLFLVLRGRMARVASVERLTSGSLSVTVANGPMPDSLEWFRVAADAPLWVKAHE